MTRITRRSAVLSQMLRTFACSTPWFVNYQHQWLLSADFTKWFVFRDQSSLNGWRGWVLEVLGGYHILFRSKRRGIKYKSFSLTLLLLFRNPLQSTSMWCLRPILQKITKRVSTEQELTISWWRIEECSGLSYLRQHDLLYCEFCRLLFLSSDPAH